MNQDVSVTDVTFDIFGINININTDNVFFREIVIKSLSYFYNNQNGIVLCPGKNIQIQYLSKKRCSPKELCREYTKIGNNAYVKDNCYIYFYGQLVVQTTYHENGLDVRAQYCEPRGIKERLKDLVLSVIFSSKRNYFLLARYLVLYPVFMLLEMEKNVFLLHSSAVEVQGRGILFGGLASVGKSLLATSLTLDHKAKFLSDNFLLIDENYIYPFPEFLRLSKDAQNRIHNTDQLGGAVLTRFGRKYYTLDRNMIAGKVKPSILFIPRLSPKTYIKKIGSETALERLLLANDHVREFPEHHFAGLLSFTREVSIAKYKQRIMTLGKVLDKLEIYELGMPDIQFPGDEILKIINDVS